MGQAAVMLSTPATISWVLAGIIISLLLPVAVRTLRSAKLESVENPSFAERLSAAWAKYGGNTYLGIAVAATFVALVLVFLLGLEFSKPRDALLAGFAWESLINKLMGPKG